MTREATDIIVTLAIRHSTRPMPSGDLAAAESWSELAFAVSERRREEAEAS